MWATPRTLGRACASNAGAIKLASARHSRMDLLIIELLCRDPIDPHAPTQPCDARTCEDAGMTPSRRTFLSLAGAAIATRPAQAATTPSPEELAAMEAVATTFLNEHSVPGLS